MGCVFSKGSHYRNAIQGIDLKKKYKIRGIEIKKTVNYSCLFRQAVRYVGSFDVKEKLISLQYRLIFNSESYTII